MTDENKTEKSISTVSIADAIEPLHPDILYKLLLDGDLSKMNDGQKMALYLHKCKSLGLDPAEHPFQLLVLNRKQVLYATRACTDALCRERKVSREILSTEKLDGLYVVRARATMADGRYAEDMGAVSIEGLKGEALANAFLKSTSKALRRVTLTLFGVGALDETEVDSIPGARRDKLPPISVRTETGEDMTFEPDRSEPARRPADDADLPKQVSWCMGEIGRLRHCLGMPERSSRVELRQLRKGKAWPAQAKLTDEDRIGAISEANITIQHMRETLADINDSDVREAEAFMPGHGGDEPEVEVMG